MASSSWTLKTFLLLVLMYEAALDDPYSNSFISPNSASQEGIDIHNTRQGETTSGPEEIQFPTFSSILKHSIKDNDDNQENILNRVERSAIPDPILSTVTATDDLIVFKNIEEALDSNDVELSGRISGFIRPSKTDKDILSPSLLQTNVPQSGESRGAPHARALQEPQEITPSATMTNNFATQSHIQGQQGRQANPDIQDIITGIVKLLNGNVNVQANTAPVMGRPLRPLSTRINNRGPPRITDVPALPPDFDIPAPLPPPLLGQMPPPLGSTRLPTPYPFDVPNMSPVRPLNGAPIPLSDQLAGPTSNKRPGFYRPVTIPPWNRRRPIPNRRPSIPSYKPMPSFPTDEVSLTSERPIDDILTLDFGSHLTSSENGENGSDTKQENEDSWNNKENITSIPEVSTSSVHDNVEVDQEIAEFERNKEKVTKLEKYTSKTTSVTPTFNVEINSETSIISTQLEEMTPSPTTTETYTTSAYTSQESFIQPSSSSQEISLQTSTNFSNETNEKSRTNDSESSTSLPILESSIQEVLSTLKEDLLSDTTTLSNTKTEQLPKITDIFSNNITASYKFESNSTVSQMSPKLTDTAQNNQSAMSSGFPYYPYRPRPGIVLDDTEYKPGGINRQPIVTRPPIGQLGDIFDITVSAIQGPGGANTAGQGKPYVIPVDIENVHAPNHPDVITSSIGSEGFVSIDGKRTYLNLFGDATPATSVASVIKPTGALHNQVTGTGYAVVDNEKPKQGLGGIKQTHRRPIYGRPRPSNQPPVRIDTCIVGDDTTCDGAQHEICKTESGVSACHCRPGTARRKHRDPCRKIVSILLSLRVDKLYDRKVIWAEELGDRNSDSFQQLSFEAERALESAMSMTPFSDEFLAAKVNSIYKGDRSQGQAGVFVNLTLQLDENADTSRPTVRNDIQRHLLGVIQRRSNNVGESALWVDSPPGSVSNLQDLDECSSPDLHDCHIQAKCINIFGGFKCECLDGYRDSWADNKHRAGRHCEQCSPQHCNNRGECKYQNGQEICICVGNYYGSQCELDGEVLGVAIAASVAAVIIIGLTLVCLVMWSRRWSREQKAAVGSPVFGYMATASNTVKTPVVGAPPYQLTLEDRLRWAQIADVMAQANHYAPEPGLTSPTRPSSAMFGYPNLSHMGTLPHHATLPPVPLPRLTLQQRAASVRPPESTSSEEEDKADLLGRSFQVPRPKSRSNASIANQSGIYYDVDYDQNEIYKSTGIPLSTYTMSRPQYFRN